MPSSRRAPPDQPDWSYRTIWVEFPAMTSSSPRPLIVRLFSGIAGVLISLVALVGSLGAALGAPVGMYLVARWAKRRERQPNRIASLFGAVVASSVLAVLIWGTVFLLMPRPTQDQLNSAVTEAQRQPTKLPEWYTRLFPQAARSDSASGPTTAMFWMFA